jgi:hypothetical protein
VEERGVTDEHVTGRDAQFVDPHRDAFDEGV